AVIEHRRGRMLQNRNSHERLAVLARGANIAYEQHSRCGGNQDEAKRKTFDREKHIGRCSGCWKWSYCCSEVDHRPAFFSFAELLISSMKALVSLITSSVIAMWPLSL